MMITRFASLMRFSIARPASCPLAGQLRAVVLLLAAAICGPSLADDDLSKQLKPLIDSHRGKVSVAIKDLKSGTVYEHRADKPMPTASMIKFPLMIAVYQAAEEGQLDLDTMITLKEEDKVPGSGILTPHFSAGTQISLRDAIQLMMVYSDNTATNLVIDQVGLPATAELMEKLGCPETKLHSKVFRRDTSIFPERSQKYGLGSATAADMVKLLEMLHQGKLVSEAASKQMLDHMYACSHRDAIPRNLPADIRIAHKGGSVSAVRTDAGIIDAASGPIAICVMTAENEDRRWEDDNEAEILCGQIALVAYEHFNPDGEPLRPTIARVLKMGSEGELVESLQRTLNARLDPSPGLGVDGDFGPATEAAVMQFQRENKLEENGEVGPEMWRALGPLVTEGEPVPEPEMINAMHFNPEERDPLEGPPFVTADAWAIADAKTGKLLWGYNDAEMRHPASTTKMMTAYVVTSLAEEDPKVLDEIVTFSERADETSGSTSGIRAGEQISVGELLYGLMLPSGNDASVALAEHFGERLGEQGDGEEKGSYEKFIAAMNRTAAELGMEETEYRNTHGLTHESHQTSARDLVKLAHAAMQQPTFRKYVSTYRHGTKVKSLAGYERNVAWRNSNRLLRVKGYDGVKTGTTGAAGACLVSRGSRGDDQLIVVVLGSKSSDARYVDSRNLYRWAWLQRGHTE